MKTVMKWFIGGIIVFTIVSLFILINLNTSESPRESDVIIVASGSIDRDYRAGVLYWQDYSRSNKIIVSPLEPPSQVAYISLGIAPDHVIEEPHATSTYTNATNTLKMMDEFGFTSAIVVTSDYHQLRTRLIYERVNREYGFDLNYVASYHQHNGVAKPWYQNPRLWMPALREVIYFYGYLIGLYYWIDR